MSFRHGPANIAFWPIIRATVFERLLHILRKKHDNTTPVSLDLPLPLETRENSQGSIFDILLQTKAPKNRTILYVSNKPSIKVHCGIPYNHWEQPTAELLGNKTVFSTTRKTNLVLPTGASIEERHFSDIYRLIGKISSTLARRTATTRIAKFTRFLNARIEHFFGKEEASFALDDIPSKLAYRLNTTHLEYFFAKRLLQKSSIRIIFISTAAYGSNIGFQIAASNLGISTAELQHGAIYSMHYAYNYGNALLKGDRARKYVPQHFLSYGTFWHDKMNMPSDMHVVGNPYFSMTSSEAKNETGSGILFALSDEYETFTPFICATLAAFPKREIIVRPHPRCTQAFASSSIAKIGGYTLDTTQNIYKTLERVECVISSGSTTLFEAGALGRRCLLKPSTLLNDNDAWSIFENVTTPQELLDKLSTPECGRLPVETQESIFHPNWKQNYSNFISSVRA